MRALVLALVLAGCGRVGFAHVADGGSIGDGESTGDVGSNVDADACPGAYCDDFERTTPIPAGDPLWMHVLCPTIGANLVVDHTLQVGYPADGGSGVAQCQLETDLLRDVQTFQLDFDLTATTNGANGNLAFFASPHITLPAVNAAGIIDLSFQVGINGFGDGQVTAVYHYPDASKSPMVGNNFPAYDIADSYATTSPRWLAFGAACHVTIAIDPAVPSAVVTLTGVSVGARTLAIKSTTAPPGITGPLQMGFGYSAVGSAVAGGTFVFDDLVVRASP